MAAGDAERREVLAHDVYELRREGHPDLARREEAKADAIRRRLARKANNRRE